MFIPRWVAHIHKAHFRVRTLILRSPEMSRAVDSPFVRSVLASALGAALFIPVDSAPWWVTVLRDLPFGGWLWPLLGGLLAWSVYRWGATAGAGDTVALTGLYTGDRNQPESKAVTALAPNPHVTDSLIQVFLSLEDATPIEVERQNKAHAGQRVTVSGAVTSVDDWTGFPSVCLAMNLDDITDKFGGPRFGRYSLEFPSSLTPVVKALAKGVHLRASGTVRELSSTMIFLDRCELLRIGGEVSDSD